MVKLALLGAGRIGQVHARTIRGMKAASVTAVSDFFPETAQALADTLGAEVRENDAIMASDDVDAVVIGTPTDTHFDLIMAAAQARKAIFCEKPVDMSADRIRELIAVVEETGVPFMTAFNRRFDPSFANVQARIEAGEVGDVEMVTILSRDPSPPPLNYIKSSGGIFRDMMIHDLDMARFRLGEDAVEVVAYGSALVDPAIGEAGDVDTAGVMLKTASGKICQISNSRRASYGYDQRIEVHGAKGMLRAENHLENTVEVATEAGYRRAPTLNFFLERYESAYRREMEHFVACLNDGVAVTPTIHDGLKAQVMADAATISCQTGKPVAI
jgi:myo-inositol 2-dehydrogenase/D-chiro-inositol 1-dehydrogenase